jgi:hypothetical protein
MQPPVPPPVAGSQVIVLFVTVTPPWLQLASLSEPVTVADIVCVRKLADDKTASSKVLLMLIFLQLPGKDLLPKRRHQKIAKNHGSGFF